MSDLGWYRWRIAALGAVSSVSHCSIASDRAREANNLALNDAAWRNQYNDLVNRYNRLLQDANRLADVQDRALNGKDGQIAELKATNAKLEARDRKTDGWSSSTFKATVRLLRGSIRETASRDLPVRLRRQSSSPFAA